MFRLLESEAPSQRTLEIRRDLKRVGAFAVLSAIMAYGSIRYAAEDEYHKNLEVKYGHCLAGTPYDLNGDAKTSVTYGDNNPVRIPFPNGILVIAAGQDTLHFQATSYEADAVPIGPGNQTTASIMYGYGCPAEKE